MQRLFGNKICKNENTEKKLDEFNYLGWQVYLHNNGRDRKLIKFQRINGTKGYFENKSLRI
jgi:hypothetical protein